MVKLNSLFALSFEFCIRELEQTLQSVGGRVERGGGGEK